MKRILIIIFVGATVFMVFQRCAKIPGSISGGIKDEVPPRFVSSNPPNYSTEFSANRIDITFDEFLQLKDVNNQFIASPPFVKQPEILLYNKTVRVSLKEELIPDVTYSFDFGESITDNNEGNKLQGFLYVFSTGTHIDSLTFTGRVLNAFDLKPRAKDDKMATWVLLYDDMSDSAVYNKTPKHVARADKFGFFTLSHVRPDTFLIFAIRDMGSNLKFDTPAEQIAFSDTLIVIDQRYYHNPEHTFYTSLNVADSVKEKNPELLHEDIVLFQFEETPTKQYRVAYERKEANKLRFVYSMPVDSMKVSIVGYEPNGSWYEFEPSRNRDTLDYWLTDTALVNQKALQINLFSPRTDSLNQIIYLHDTLKMTYDAPRPAPDNTSRKGKPEDKDKPKPRTPLQTMTIGSNIKTGTTMELTDRLQLIASQPISQIDQSKIIFEELVDTIRKPVQYTLAKDSVNTRKSYIDWKLKEDTKYYLTIDTMAFSSIYRVYNDSAHIGFATQKKDYYSSIEVTFDTIPCPMLVQVIKGEKEVLVKQVTLPHGTTVLIDFLKPEKYQLKVVYDRNNNGRWDTGHYLRKEQPEMVEYYHEAEIETKSSWKTEIKWTLKRSGQ